MGGQEKAPVKEIIKHVHDVNGIIFYTRGDGSIFGAGRQGRSFKFKPGQEDVLIDVIQQLDDKIPSLKSPTSRSTKDITTIIGSQENKLDDIFDVSFEDGWVEGRSKTGKSSFAMAINDREAIVYALKELKILLTGKNSSKRHFCEQFGVIDDD